MRVQKARSSRGSLSTHGGGVSAPHADLQNVPVASRAPFSTVSVNPVAKQPAVFVEALGQRQALSPVRHAKQSQPQVVVLLPVPSKAGRAVKGNSRGALQPKESALNARIGPAALSLSCRSKDSLDQLRRFIKPFCPRYALQDLAEHLQLTGLSHQDIPRLSRVELAHLVTQDLPLALQSSGWQLVDNLTKALWLPASPVIGTPTVKILLEEANVACWLQAMHPALSSTEVLKFAETVGLDWVALTQPPLDVQERWMAWDAWQTLYAHRVALSLKILLWHRLNAWCDTLIKLKAVESGSLSAFWRLPPVDERGGVWLERERASY